MAQGFFGFLDFTGLLVAQGTGVFFMLNEILNATVSDLNGLGLTLNGNTITAVRRKGTKRQPGVDASTQITVCKNPKKPLQLKYMAFGNTTAIYPIDIAIVSPNTRDWVTNLDTYIDWWDTIIAKFVPPSLTSTQLWQTKVNSNKVFDVRVASGDFLEPAQMANQFDVVNIELAVQASIVSST